MTLSDVAREAGVSLATASRAINGSANRTVRADLADRVLAAAARLRYTPDANAQAMARGRTTSLGLVVHDIADPYFSSIAAGVARAADRAGLQVTLASTQHDPSRESGLVDLLKRQRARAIVIAGGRLDDQATNDELRAALADYRSVGGVRGADRAADPGRRQRGRRQRAGRRRPGQGPARPRLPQVRGARRPGRAPDRARAQRRRSAVRSRSWAARSRTTR